MPQRAGVNGTPMPAPATNTRPSERRGSPRPSPCPLEGWGSQQAGSGAVGTSIFRSPIGTRWTSVRNTAPALINLPCETRSASSQTQTQPLPSPRREGQHAGLEGLAGGPDSPVSQGNEGGDLPGHCVLVGGAPGADGPWWSWPGPAGQVAVARRPAGTPPPASPTARRDGCGCAGAAVPTSPAQGPGPGRGPGWALPAGLGVRPHHRVPGVWRLRVLTSGCSRPGRLTLSSSSRAPGVPSGWVLISGQVPGESTCPLPGPGPGLGSSGLCPNPHCRLNLWGGGVSGGPVGAAGALQTRSWGPQSLLPQGQSGEEWPQGEVGAGTDPERRTAPLGALTPPMNYSAEPPVHLPGAWGPRWALSPAAALRLRPA